MRNSAEVVFNNSRVQIAGNNTLDKLAEQSSRGIMNILNDSNTKIQTRHLQKHLHDTGYSLGPMENIVDILNCQ